MCYMFEVFYRPPADVEKEAALTANVSSFGGRLSHRELTNGESSAICLAYEFDERSQAESAAEALRKRGEHVEGPMEYGPNSK
ncbi:MAG: hypothetical protein WD894_17225 [Pirellulales bacterium]